MTTQQKLDCLDKAGLILWTKKRDGMPRYKLYLKKGGMYMTDMITDVNSLSAHSARVSGVPDAEAVGPFGAPDRRVFQRGRPGAGSVLRMRHCLLCSRKAGPAVDGHRPLAEGV